MDGQNYLELTATTFDQAKELANGQMSGGAVDYVAMQVGSDVVVFADTGGAPDADTAAALVGRTLADISPSNIPGS